jgi:hypothetical protein
MAERAHRPDGIFQNLKTRKVMNARILALGIVAAALAAFLTRPSIRAELRDALDPSSQVAVARTICQAEADLGKSGFDVCIHRAFPHLPAALVNMKDLPAALLSIAGQR